MNVPARKKSSMQNKLVRALEMRNEEGEALTALRSLREDRRGNNTREKQYEIFPPAETSEEDAVKTVIRM